MALASSQRPIAEGANQEIKTHAKALSLLVMVGLLLANPTAAVAVDSNRSFAKVLSDHPGAATALTEEQKQEIESVVVRSGGNAYLVCTGVSLRGQRESIYRVVRLRAALRTAIFREPNSFERSREREPNRPNRDSTDQRNLFVALACSYQLYHLKLSAAEFFESGCCLEIFTVLRAMTPRHLFFTLASLSETRSCDLSIYAEPAGSALVVLPTTFGSARFVRKTIARPGELVFNTAARSKPSGPGSRSTSKSATSGSKTRATLRAALAVYATATS